MNSVYDRMIVESLFMLCLHCLISLQNKLTYKINIVTQLLGVNKLLDMVANC